MENAAFITLSKHMTKLKSGGTNMATHFSSAGLLYVYLNGYEDNGRLYVQQFDSYRYIGDEL